MFLARKWLSWGLPFEGKCDSRCEYDLHNAYCMIFPLLGTVAALSLIGFLRGVFTLEFLSWCSLSYQGAMLIVLAAFATIFAATWRWQKKATIYLWCRRCRGKERELNLTEEEK